MYRKVLYKESDGLSNSCRTDKCIGLLLHHVYRYIKALTKVATRYAPSRTLSFDVVHVKQAGRICARSLHLEKEPSRHW